MPGSSPAFHALFRVWTFGPPPISPLLGLQRDAHRLSLKEPNSVFKLCLEKNEKSPGRSQDGVHVQAPWAQSRAPAFPSQAPLSAHDSQFSSLRLKVTQWSPEVRLVLRVQRGAAAASPLLAGAAGRFFPGAHARQPCRGALPAPFGLLGGREHEAFCSTP